MANPDDRSPRAGGLLLVLAIFAGVAVGAATGQVTIGFLGGLIIGSALAVLVWLADRRSPQ